MTFDESQLAAIERAKAERFCIVNGGAGCLSGDTVICVHRKNHTRKYSLKKAYHSFNNVKCGDRKKNGRVKFWKDHGSILCKADIGAKIGFHNIHGIVYSGKKNVYLVEDSIGNKIKATKDHMFLTPDGTFWALEFLVVGCSICVCVEQVAKKEKKHGPRKIQSSLKFHQVAKQHKRHVRVKSKNWEKDYYYQRVHHARLVVEASMNDLSVNEFIQILRTDEAKAKTFKYLTSDQEVHHIDFNTENDSLDNLKVLTTEEHTREHCRLSSMQNQFNVKTVSVITKIELVGIEDTYDIIMEDPYRNFVANNFIVHNSGKTTIIKAIADAMKKTKENYAMCAFAGKAAARLKEATGHNATTIHRMLEYKGDFGFSLRTLKGTTVIIDEASMVSSDLMAEIVKREPARLILVGDEAQLAPVGSGQPFHDIIKLFPGKVSTLTTCYRNKEAIFKAALAIRHGDIPLPQDKTDDETWGFYATGGAEATHEMLLTGVRNGDIDFAQDVILCCRNGENEMQKASVKSMNIDIKAIVNPSDTPISVGDRIINTKNNADLDIWNGTTGSVKAIDHDGGVWFTLDYPVTDWVRSTAENTVYINEVLVPKDHRKFLDLAYALTVHKSQGSQYRKVFCVCLCRDQMTLLDRSMIYTAVTRARKECAVLGEPRALQDAVRTVRTKNTVIQELAKGTKTT